MYFGSSFFRNVLHSLSSNDDMAKGSRKRWSKQVTEKGNALDLEQGVFSKDDPCGIARSLKRSVDCSRLARAILFGLPWSHDLVLIYVRTPSG